VTSSLASPFENYGAIRAGVAGLASSATLTSSPPGSFNHVLNAAYHRHAPGADGQMLSALGVLERGYLDEPDRAGIVSGRFS
jgi:hypothetical protein